MNVPFIAYKGFDKDLKCRGYQYKIGDVFTHPSVPRRCGEGFHFCFELKDCFNYYTNNGQNRFCTVEVMGAVVKEDDKGCTNVMRIIEEIDISKMLIRDEIARFLKLREQHTDLILGGSLALILQEIIPYRKTNDIDVVSHRYFEFKDSQVKGESLSEDNDAIKIFVPNVGNVDYFVIPKAVYRTILFEGMEIKVQSPAQIMEAKLKYFHRGVEKHKPDLLNYLGGWKPKSNDQDLPF